MIITPTPSERLFVGSLRSAERLAQANPLGIRTTVSVCAEKVQSKCPEITYVQFPMLDAQPGVLVFSLSGGADGPSVAPLSEQLKTQLPADSLCAKCVPDFRLEHSQGGTQVRLDHE